MPATEVKQQVTTNRRDETRMRGWHNAITRVMTAMGTMATVTVIAATTMTMTTTLAAAASIKG